MAIAAELGDIGAVRLVPLIAMREDLVLAMTIRAIRRVCVLLEIPLSMVTFKIVFSDLGVAV